VDHMSLHGLASVTIGVPDDLADLMIGSHASA
jgi:hypothetical protein